MKALLKGMQGKASAAIQLLAIVVVAVALGMAMLAPHGMKAAFADTQNYSPATAVYAIPIQLSGTYSADLSGVAAIKMPYASRLIGFTAKSRVFTGAGSPTVTLRANGASLLSAPLGLSTVAVTEATIATPAIADETTVYVDLALGGMSTIVDTTLLMTVVR